MQREIYDLYMRQLQQLNASRVLQDVNLTVLNFTIFGIINWFYRWYKSGKSLNEENVANQMVKILNFGILRANRLLDGYRDAWNGCWRARGRELGCQSARMFLRTPPYLPIRRNCRIPDKNYLNMKARISSQMMTRRRINDIIKEYRRDTFVNVLGQIINHTNFSLKSRLRQIPEGVWLERGRAFKANHYLTI